MPLGINEPYRPPQGAQLEASRWMIAEANSYACRHQRVLLITPEVLG